MVIVFTFMVAEQRLKSMAFYVCFAIFSTLYSYSWDIVMDWGLLRGTKGGRINRLLRDKIKYPPSLYIFSAITNFFLRFAWVVTLVP